MQTTRPSFKYFLKNSPSTPRITDTESRQLPTSVIRRVVDSAYHWYGESVFERKKISLAPISRKKERKNMQTLTPRIVDTGSRYLREKKISLAPIFRTLPSYSIFLAHANVYVEKYYKMDGHIPRLQQYTTDRSMSNFKKIISNGFCLRTLNGSGMQKNGPRTCIQGGNN